MSVNMSDKFQSYYRAHEILGEGSFGKVKRCVDIMTGEEFAVKIIKKSKNPEDMEDVMYEVDICRQLQHPNIVQLLDVFDQTKHLYLVFDLVVGGELYHDIARRAFYTEFYASICMQQILEAVNYCHRNGIVHRDLKPENILLVSQEEGAAIKIADFGLAIEVDGDEFDDRWGYGGTRLYMAPEMITEDIYGKPIDLWSCGVILYNLLVGDDPFYDEKSGRLDKFKVITGTYQYPNDRHNAISANAKDFIRKMLTPNPYRRITAAQSLKQPWIRQRDIAAPKKHMPETIDRLKKFNARRKFKAAVHAAVAVRKLLKRKGSDPNDATQIPRKKRKTY